MIAALLSLLSTAAPEPSRYVAITVVDADTGRGVPLVELRTVNGLRYVTDSAGALAFGEPGLMGQTVFFHVASHGYEFPADGFGYRGAALHVTEGGSATLRLKRLNLAERLYRVTGEGVYRDSLLLGRPAPIRHPALNAQVLGSDSVVNAVYHGRIYWFWGDTNRVGYPLGNFHVPGATSRLPSRGGLDPGVGIDLDYFVDEHGFAKETCHMPGDRPTWIGGLAVLRDRSGRERMFAHYVKVRSPTEVCQQGLVEWNDGGKRFEKVAEFPLDAPGGFGGHTFLYSEAGVEYVYYASPYPLTRVRATPEDLANPASYECYSYLVPGSRVEEMRVDRAADGIVSYAWKHNTPLVGPAEQAKLIAAGLLKPDEALLRLQDPATGRPVTLHRGSVYWNAYRRRWVMIAVESGGTTSFLGEVWYAEADALTGPWLNPRKIVTHDRYSFYNPKQDPMFDQQGGRVIYFEGTYASTFSGNPDPTPRYDYNQVMYRLDLADPRLALPVRPMAH